MTKKRHINTKDENLQEENEKVEYINHPHDKIIRDVLLDKEEGSYFINKALNLKEEEQLSEKNLYNYNNSFVNNKLQNKIPDVVYKVIKEETNNKEVKNKEIENVEIKEQGEKDKSEEREIYIIIEHQSKKDPLMEYRFFDYKVEITRLALDKSKVGEESYKEPSVIGILLYTGKEGWRKETEDNNNKFQEKRTLESWTKQEYTKYKLVEASKMSEEELLKENTLLSKILLIEKAESTEEMMEMYSKIMNQNLSITTIEKIENYIIIILSQFLKKDKKELEKVLKNFEGRKNTMMHIEEVLIRERKKDRAEARAEGLAEGRKEGRVQARAEAKREARAEKIKMIKKMLLNKEQDNKIKEYADVSSKELDKIKKELLTQNA